MGQISDALDKATSLEANTSSIAYPKVTTQELLLNNRKGGCEAIDPK